MISTISVDVSVTEKLKYEATNLLHKIPSTRSRVSKGSTRGTEVIILFVIFQPSFLSSQYECHHWFQALHIDLVFIAGAFLSIIAVAIVVASTNRAFAHLSQNDIAWGSSRNEILYFTRCCDPPPQVWLQELHSVQGVQAGQGPAWIGFKISSSWTCGMWMRRQLRRWWGRLSDSPRALQA